MAAPLAPLVPPPSPTPLADNRIHWVLWSPGYSPHALVVEAETAAGARTAVLRKGFVPMLCGVVNGTRPFRAPLSGKHAWRPAPCEMTPGSFSVEDQPGRAATLKALRALKGHLRVTHLWVELVEKTSRAARADTEAVEVALDQQARDLNDLGVFIMDD